MDPAIIKQKILSASEEIKNIIYSFDIIDLEEKLTEKNKLAGQQGDKMRKEIISVLVGVTKKNDFLNQLVTLGISQDVAKKIEIEVDEKIFSRVRASLEKVQSEEIKTEVIMPVTSIPRSEEVLNKNDVLDEIENPVPTKPIVSNPAGKNVILDAQHNLPEQEKKILISSAAVPSRGPILNNFKNSFGTAPATPVAPTIPTPIPVIPATPVVLAPTHAIPTTPTIPATPKPVAQPIQQPIQSQPIVQTPQPVQSPKPPQAPIPPAPSKYTVDPYREPLE